VDLSCSYDYSACVYTISISSITGNVYPAWKIQSSIISVAGHQNRSECRYIVHGFSRRSIPGIHHDSGQCRYRTRNLHRGPRLFITMYSERSAIIRFQGMHRRECLHRHLRCHTTRRHDWKKFDYCRRIGGNQGYPAKFCSSRRSRENHQYPG